MSDLNIYFGGSISAGRQDAALYAKIIKYLQSYGTVLTEHVGNEDKCKEDAAATPTYIHDRDIEWMQQAHVLVAEVTQPSLGVGYEIGRAVASKIPVLCLYRPTQGKRLSCMIDGAHNGNTFVVKRYEEQEYPEVLKEYFENFQKK